jgi:two-component sensor histidine kinase/CheY-like chemotaxis protein
MQYPAEPRVVGGRGGDRFVMQFALEGEPFDSAVGDHLSAPGHDSGAGASALHEVCAEDDTLLAVRAAAITAERARISREMNESASKSLLGISMLAASLATAGWSGDARSVDYRVRELARLARQAVTEASGVINDLREDAVASQLRSAAMAWSLSSGISVDVNVPRVTETTESIRCEFDAILREALINVQKHANASRVQVSLRTASEQLQLTIEDNGVGFSMPATVSELYPVAYGGLSAIRERAQRLDGVVLIRSSPGHGTRIEVRIPGPYRARQQLRVAAAPMRKVRVAIADCNPILRFGPCAVLQQTPGVEVVAELTTGTDLAHFVGQHLPDVLLLEARMPLPAGMQTVRQVSELTSIVVVSCTDDDPLAVEAAAAGVRLIAW